jgi:uncharacterized protein YndB with AHSA1/START domain
MAEDTYTVTRETTIDAPPARVYEEIADFHNWTHWSPWEDLDPDLKRTYSGSESGKGAAYAWSGNRKAGEGRMEITQATEPSKVRIDLAFLKPFKAQSEVLFTIAPDATGSRVTWVIVGQKSLMTKVMGVFKSMDKMIGPDLDKGLSRLKATSEKPATS